MNTPTLYADLIKTALHEYVKDISIARPLESLVICDDASGNYLLIHVGWTLGKRHHSIIFHARLHEGKVRIEWDATEPSITERLFERGMVREDIGMGWESQILPESQHMVTAIVQPTLPVQSSGITTLLDIIEPDELASLLIVGLDITGSPKKKTGYCLLEGLTASTRRLRTNDELIEAIIHDQPTVVTIDSPLTLPRGRLHVGDDDPTRATHGIIRQCERQLRKRGIHVFWSLLPSMQQLTARGIELAGRLRTLGFEVIEVFPGAAQDVMLIPRKQKGLEALEQGLTTWGLTGAWQAKRVSHDELDAITAAMVGLFYLTDHYEAIGEEAEGQIILPRLAALGGPTIPAPSG